MLKFREDKINHFMGGRRMKCLPFVLPVLRSIFFIMAFISLSLITHQSLDALSQYWSIITILVNIVTILLLYFIFKKEGTTFKKVIGIKKEQKKYIGFIILLMLLLGMGGMIGFGFLIYGYLPLTMIQPLPIYLAIINLILLPITIIFAELPLYFGYSLTKIERMTRNKKLAILYPMFFYALQHSFIPLLFDWHHLLFRFLSFLPLMLVLGFIYYKKRQLKPLMMGHFILDVATGLQILITSIHQELYDLMGRF
jgi:hypothetical protein